MHDLAAQTGKINLAVIGVTGLSSRLVGQKPKVSYLLRLTRLIDTAWHFSYQVSGIATAGLLTKTRTRICSEA